MLGLAAVLAGGCGSGGHFANDPRPPSPVNVTVYINDQRVSLSPSSVGAGPVVFIVTNQASQAVSMRILQTGNAVPAARTGPITPQATAQITVNLNRPQTTYKVVTSAKAATEAAAATATPIQPALLHIGNQRASASNELQAP